MKYFILVVICLTGCGPETIENNSPVVTQPSESVSVQSSRTTPLSVYGRAKISVSGKAIEVYVADDIAERTEGLMFVKDSELEPDEGMVFVFEDAKPLSFWMENTLMALDIAYLDEGGKILNIRQMQPLDRSPQPSEGAAKYAVEMHEGWFEENKIKVGAKFDLSGLK